MVADQPAGSLTDAERERYRRHLSLPEVGLDGQLRLRASSVLVIGAGGLGCPAALYLAAAGVGRIGLVDFDEVELSNLQRQVLYSTDHVGDPKTRRAGERLAALNPHIRVETHALRLAAANVRPLVRAYDVVLDGTDNFPTRYLINDACVLERTPNVYGSIFRFEGQVSLFATRGGPCYRCLYPEPPAAGAVPNCAEGGVLGVLPGTIGTLQATEAIKLLLGKGESLAGRLLLFDALELRFRELELRRDAACPVCGDSPTIHQVQDQPQAACPPAPPRSSNIEVDELSRLLAGSQSPQLLDVRTEPEWEIVRLEGAQLIPLQQLEQRMAEVDRDADLVVYCHHGSRSAMAVSWLLQAGYPRVRNLAGGIDAWACRIDPSLPRY